MSEGKGGRHPQGSNDTGPGPTRRSVSGTSTFRRLGTILGVSVLVAASQSMPASADERVQVGGLRFERHWSSSEVIADKAFTTAMANAPEEACAGLVAGGIPGVALAGWCGAYAKWFSGVARDALDQDACFRVVLPLHNPNWSYPSTHNTDWC